MADPKLFPETGSSQPSHLPRGSQTALDASQLRPGDLVLTTGVDWVRQAIQHFDESPVSHVAILASNAQVIEASGRGIDCRELVIGGPGARRSVVRRWDPTRASSQRLLPCAWEQAAAGDRRAYDPALLLAMVLLVRETSMTPHFGRLARNVLALAAMTITRWLEERRSPLLSPWFIDFQRCGVEFRETPETTPGWRRIQPSSVLARVLRTMELGAADALQGTPIDAAPPAAGTDAEAIAREAEAAFDQHVDWLWACQEHALAPVVDPTPLAPSILRFASALCAARLLPSEPIEGETCSAASPPPAPSAADAAAPPLVLAHLQEAAAGLITPGDLLRCGSLVTLGTLPVL